jgi:hypothetical protein
LTLLFDEDYATAPHDPEMAFVHLSQIAKERMYEAISNEETYNNSRIDETPHWMELAATVEGLVEALGLDLDVDLKPPLSESGFDEWLVWFKSKLTSISTRIRLNAARAGGSANNPTLTFEALDLSDVRDEIRTHTERIRKIINSVAIDESLRELLFDRLNAFERDLERNRTRWEAFLSLFRATTHAVGEGAEDLEPVVKQLERVMGAMEKASPVKKLTSQTKKLLPAPKDDCSGEPSDDEIPF